MIWQSSTYSLTQREIQDQGFDRDTIYLQYTIFNEYKP